MPYFFYFPSVSTRMKNTKCLWVKRPFTVVDAISFIHQNPSQTAGKCSKSFQDNLDSWEATKRMKHKRHHEEGERRKKRRVREWRRRRRENKWHSAVRSTLATWLFQNESNARPKNEKKKREKNQYSTIKHKARLCGAEGNLLFIKFTPPPSSPPNPITPQSLMHELASLSCPLFR